MQLFPLINENHAFRVDQSEAVDPPQTNVEAVLGVGGLVDRRRVSEGMRLVQRARRGRLERYQVLEVVDLG
jgi:hypothetical protein